MSCLICLDVVERTKFRSTLLPKTGKIVAETGNNVEATFDFVERPKFYDKLVRHCCRFLATKSNVASIQSNVASTLLLVWTGLKKD